MDPTESRNALQSVRSRSMAKPIFLSLLFLTLGLSAGDAIACVNKDPCVCPCNARYPYDPQAASRCISQCNMEQPDLTPHATPLASCGSQAPVFHTKGDSAESLDEARVNAGSLAAKQCRQVCQFPGSLAHQCGVDDSGFVDGRYFVVASFNCFCPF